MNIIELKDIRFRYSDEEKPVFDGFDFSVKKGSCISVVGENGAGKTTLFRILNGLSFPEKGQYFFDGEEISEKYLRNNKNSKLFHKRVGFLFQNPDVMLFNANVYDEIAFGPRQMGLEDEEVKARTEDLLRLFELEKLAGKAPYHLSSGQKKRVALAAVMSLNPEVLILDEPFAGLDLKNRDRFMEFFTGLKKAGKTLIVATHNPEFSDKLADEVLTINPVSEGDNYDDDKL